MWTGERREWFSSESAAPRHCIGDVCRIHRPETNTTCMSSVDVLCYIDCKTDVVVQVSTSIESEERIVNNPGIRADKLKLGTCIE